MYRFDAHTFDPGTGELDGSGGSLRLQPKPARLLAMLLDAGGELVERETIREALWPDTNVDFDAGLNTCVRQIRTALQETGGSAECIETLPKRGYRFVAPLAGDGDHARPGTPAMARTGPVRLGSAAALPYVVVFVLIAIGTVAVMWAELAGFDNPEPGNAVPADAVSADAAVASPGNDASAPTVAREAPARLALLPLVDPDTDDPGPFNRALTEAYLTALVAEAPEELVVVGPATTRAPFAAGASPAEIAEAVDADFLLHGGHRAGTGVFFLEVITPDGGHVFARRVDLNASAPAAADPDMVSALTTAIAEARRQR